MKRLHDRGASAVEYGLLVAAIAAVIVGIAFGFGLASKGLFAETKACMDAKVNAVNPCYKG